MIASGTPRRILLARALRAGALLAASPALAVPAAAAPSTVAARPGAPTALHIPAVALSAPIEPVWLTLPETADASHAAPDRLTHAGAPAEIGLPTHPDTAGWYALGAIPGEPGDALLVGHVDTVSGPAVFTRLPQVRPGAEIVLELDGASPATFAVESVRRHPAHLPAPADLFGLDGPPRLHLVTCTGSFIRARGGYQDRLIVTASLVPVADPAPEGAEQSP